MTATPNDIIKWFEDNTTIPSNCICLRFVPSTVCDIGIISDPALKSVQTITSIGLVNLDNDLNSIHSMLKTIYDNYVNKESN